MIYFTLFGKYFGENRKIHSGDRIDRQELYIVYSMHDENTIRLRLLPAVSYPTRRRRDKSPCVCLAALRAVRGDKTKTGDTGHSTAAWVCQGQCHSFCLQGQPLRIRDDSQRYDRTTTRERGSREGRREKSFIRHTNKFRFNNNLELRE